MMERSKKDIALFLSMIKEVMKIHATSSKSFRAGKKQEDRPRLLIITLDNPACKYDILRCAPQLRTTTEFGKVFITPDLTYKERETNRKLREELAVRRRAGEVNLTIKGGRIIKGAARASEVSSSVGKHQHASMPPETHSSAGVKNHRGEQPTHPVDQGDNIPAAPGSSIGGQPTQLTAVSPMETSHDGDASAVPVSSSGGQSAQHSDLPQTQASQLDGTSAVLCSGSRGQPTQKVDQLPTQTSLHEDSSTVISSGNTEQPAQTPKETPQADATPAVLCSGGRGQVQPAHEMDQSPLEISLGEGPSPVLSSGSRGTPDQCADKLPGEMIQTSGTSAVLGSGSGGQHALTPSETSQDVPIDSTPNHQVEKK